MTVVDLLDKVLRPIANGRKLNSWDSIQQFTEDEWFPTRIGFGKFKGRSFQDARHDRQLKEWFEWLTESKNVRTARMGAWYLSNLEKQEPVHQDLAAAAIDLNTSHEPRGGMRSGIVLFHSLELDEIRFLVTAARERLADLEVIYARECNAIAVTQSRLFSILRDAYQKRDRLKIKLLYRRRFLDSISSSHFDLDEIRNEYEGEKQKSDREYDQASKIAESQKILTEDQQAELKALFRKLVRLFHPDRHVKDAEAYKAYTLLTQEITTARDAGDIDKLREIASDPHAYAKKIGAGQIDLSDEAELEKLKRLYESIQTKILEMLEALDELRSDPKHELAQLSARRPDYLNEVAVEFRADIERECEMLEREAADLADQIEELTGSPVGDAHS
jgi:DNA polymerase-3 subunit epsilon